MHIAITGTHGLIGSELVKQLEKGGHRVTRLVRRVPRADNEARWNPSADLPLDLPEDVDALIHLAGSNVVRRWTPFTKAKIRRSRIEPTRRISAQLAKMDSPPRIFLCASAIGIYGERGDKWLTEDSELGEGFRAEVCREWEATTQPAQDAGIRVVNMRLGIVLSGSGGALRKMLPAFRCGLGGKMGSGRQYWSWVSMSDVMRAIGFILGHEELRGPINVTSPQPVTNREFAHVLARVLDKPALLPVPALALRLAFSRLADEVLLSSARVHPKRLEKAGFSFRYEKLEGALRRALHR